MTTKTLGCGCKMSIGGDGEVASVDLCALHEEPGLDLEQRIAVFKELDK